ncbi:MAG: glycerol-3-phosphate cytidylyltransferase [marine bacterium B5-7]|nr:MAG: glycerol-3-phosphate cytidylyltransferase [marine bacterium B5-7]
MAKFASGDRRIYTVLVGDLFHYGHVQFLKRARSLGDYLITGVVQDNVARAYKRTPILTLDERIQVIAACRYVDEAWEMTEALDNDFMRRHNLHRYVYAVADDTEDERIKSAHNKRLDSHYFHRIAYTPGISTTSIITRVLQRDELCQEVTPIDV